MQYRHGHAEVQAEGFTESADFSIAASGKAFKSLIDGLYSRKIEAVMRELATNAFDAHLAADTIQPFTVHLPSTFSPTFWIRDYGTGMTHDTVMRRYTTLFDSTKDGLQAADLITAANDDAKVWDGVTGHGLSPVIHPAIMQHEEVVKKANKQVGMLGLGSKSFFAYTDSCTITIWMDGEVRLYTIYMGANGVPKIALAGSAASDEPRGVKVEFAVKNKDINEFKTVAVRVFKGFNILPDGLPGDVMADLQVSPSEIGSFWKAYPKDYLPGSGFYARQGCVLYPIDLSLIAYEDHKDSQPAALSPGKVKGFENVGLTVVMDFPIGSLEFDVSRERLAYTEDTIEALRGKWVEFVADLDNTYNRQFTEARNPWQRRAIVRGNDLFSGLGPLFHSSKFYAVAHKIDSLLEAGLPSRRKNFGMGHAGHKHCFTKAIKRETPNKNVTSYDSYHTVCYQREMYGWSSSAVHDAILVYIDVPKARSVNLRIEKYLQSIGTQWALVFAPGKLTRKRWREFGCPKIVRLSEMPEPPKAPASSVPSDRKPFIRFKAMDKKGDYIMDSTEEDIEGHLICFLHKGQVVNPDPEVYPNVFIREVQEMHRVLRAFTGQSISFINVRKNEKLDKWAHLPKFYGCLDGLVDEFSPHTIRKIINVLNYTRFIHSKYGVILKTWSEMMPKGRRDPIMNLDRFEKRYKRVNKDDKKAYENFILTGLLEDQLETVIARGLEAGLEVLPDTEGDYRGRGHQVLLLPNKYERAGDALKNLNTHRLNPLIPQLLKDYVSC